MSQQGKSYLTQDDYPKIAQFLSSLSPDEQVQVAHKLGLPFSTLKDIRPSSLLSDVVHAWLREEPTWKSLQKALVACGYDSIASDIKKWRSKSPGFDADEDHVKFLSAEDAWELEHESNAAANEFTSSLPPVVHPLLEHRLADRDLHQLAHHMLGWDVELSTHLCLTEEDISDIKKKYRRPKQQQQEALRRWKRRQMDTVTFGKLLQVFADAGHQQCAEALCALIMKKYYIDEIFQAAKKNLKIKRKHAHSMFIGPGESGKSSLMYRLLGRRKHISTSTGVAEPIIVADILSAIVHASDIWEEVEFDESLVGLMHEESQGSQPETPDLKSPLSDGKGAKAVPKLSLAERRRVEINDKLKDIISSTVTKYGGDKAFENYLKKKFSIYMRDAGGQVEFQQMVSLLVFGPSIFIFVFRAYFDLNSKFEVGYRSGDSSRINCYTSSLTLEEALLQSLASVYAIGSPSKTSDIKTHKPYVIIVATHKDQLGPSADAKIKELNKNLHSLITKSGFEGLVQYAENKEKQVAFIVDNTSESDDDFKPIRKKIHNLIVGRNEFSIDYPMSYLLFSLELQHDKRNILSLAECEEMSVKYGIERKEVVHLLNFLHLRIGVIQFINIQGVRPTVLKRPEDLFNKVTELAVRTFPSSDALTTCEFNEFENKGILPLSAFDNVSGRDDFFTCDEFIKILEYLHIITPISVGGNTKYFIPCVLNHVPEPDEEHQQESEVMPLLITFESRHCPKGLFGVLITYLMADSSTFQLNQDSIFKDQISLKVISPGVRDEISLKAHSSHFEIKLYPESSETDRKTPLSEVGCSIRQKLDCYIDKSIKTLHYAKENVKQLMCLHCSNCDQFHEVDEYNHIHCRRKRFDIPQEGQYWFMKGCEKSSLEPPLKRLKTEKLYSEAAASSIEAASLTVTLHMTPHYNIVYKALCNSIAPDWQHFGSFLDMDPNLMQRIEKDNRDSRACFGKMITEWLKQIDPEPTKARIIEALKGSGFNQEAKELSTKL